MASPSPEEEFPDNLWFRLEMNGAQLFQKALRPLFQSAYSDKEYPEEMFLAGKILDDGLMSISKTDGVLLASKATFRSTVYTTLSLPISTFTQFRCRQDRVLRLHLGLLEHRINATVGGYDSDDDVSIRFSGESTNYNTLIYGVRDGGVDGGELETSEIALMNSKPGRVVGHVSKYQLSIEMPAETFMQLIDFLSLYGSAVKATVTNTQIMFCVVNKEVVLRAEAERYKIVHSAGQYPYLLEFGLDQKSAFLNAAILSNIVRLHQLTDSRTVLEVPISALGSLMFYSKLRQ
ncbi:uncharacterized protein LOC133718803 [Rosa rugosa]|uniref:uncharacterized protein LOC133718803 n=1 Tax=Rosa rugosa TaxID=74645 RepID=UPI002B40A998|nr:uncharacterized protein LOC133718803 [Rosa rugosa]